jgi:hypothetical protein
MTAIIIGCGDVAGSDSIIAAWFEPGRGRRAKLRSNRVRAAPYCKDPRRRCTGGGPARTTCLAAIAHYGNMHLVGARSRKPARRELRFLRSQVMVANSPFTFD